MSPNATIKIIIIFLSTLALSSCPPSDDTKERASDIWDAPEKIKELEATVKDHAQTIQEQKEQLDKYNQSTVSAIAQRAGVNLFTPEVHWAALKITIAIFIAPFIFRIILYWLIAPIIMKHKNIRLFDYQKNPINATSSKTLTSQESQKLFSINIPSKSSLVIVNEEDVSGISNDKNVIKGFVWLFSWRYFLMSFLNGLRTMNKYQNISSENTSIDITSSDPDEYFIEVDLTNCENMFIVPSRIKAYTPGLKLNCTWRFSLISLILMQVRYYTISGTGKIVLSSIGGITNKSLSHNLPHRRKISTLILADPYLEMNVLRTEHAYNYLFGKTSLFDLSLKGEGNYLISHSPSKTGILNLSSDNIFSIAGKFFGF